jgi:hypothetical protein
VTEIPLLRLQLPQLRARVRHQHPAALEVGPEERRDAVGAARREQRHERRLVVERVHVRLEPDVALIRRHAQHRRPRIDVGLLDLARPA